jgi:hypothetical protein
MVYEPVRAVTPSPENVRVPLEVEIVGVAKVAPVEALATIDTVLPSPLVMVLFHASRTTTVG